MDGFLHGVLVDETLLYSGGQRLNLKVMLTSQKLFLGALFSSDGIEQAYAEGVVAACHSPSLYVPFPFSLSTMLSIKGLKKSPKIYFKRCRF